MTIAFTKVALPYGWLGNMSPHPVQYDGKWWPTTEHLFQALRFDPKKDMRIIEEIRAKSSPMGAKMHSKKHKDRWVIAPQRRQDLANMRLVLRLKLKHHPELRQQLLDTGNQTIIEDATSHPHGSGKFWGAVWQDGQWIGENVLGKTWMKLRDRLMGRSLIAAKASFRIEEVEAVKRVIDRIGAEKTRELAAVLG